MRTIGLALIVAVGLSVAGQDRPSPLDGYQDWDAFEKAIHKIRLGGNTRVATIGQTLSGRDIFVLTVGTGNFDSKPAILVLGSVHGPHLLGSELAVRMARSLAKNDDLLEEATFYIIPRPNPDASLRAFQRPLVENAGNWRETDDDRDGENGEDPPEDLNGDGCITVMRVEDPSGKYMPHPDDPRVLIEADRKKNEQPRYAVYTEGRDNDEDETFNEDGPGGVDFNRNFTFKYPYFKPGAGPHQISEPETRAVADFAYDHTNIAAVFTFTPEDNLFHLWRVDGNAERGRIKTTLLSKDAPYVKHIAEEYKKLHGGKDAPKPPGGAGSFSQWAYWHYGRWSFAARGWWIPKVEVKKEGEEKEKKKEEKRGADLVNALRWFKQEGIDGAVEWTKIDHPDFEDKKVEVGGFKPFYMLNPPAKELDALAEKHLQFMSKLVGFLPKVSLKDVKVEALGEGVFRLTADAVNGGYLPTMSEMGRISRKPYPLWARLRLPDGAKLVTGHLKESLPVLSGNGGKHEITRLILAPRGGEVHLSLWCPSIGTDAAVVELK
jgi:hypothetical protein